MGFDKMTKKDLLMDLDNEVRRIQSLKKPCTEPYKYSDGLSKKVKKVLDGIEKDNNTSWAVFMYERNFSSDSMNKVADLYRGNKITYGEMYARAFEYCKSLKVMGVKKGDQVPVCISDIPEYKILLLACSFIGATIHLVGDWFSKESLLNILNKTNSKVLFVSEDCYSKIFETIEESNIETPVLISLSDSLMRDQKGNPFNPYQKIDGPEHDFSSHFEEYKSKSCKNLINQERFIEYGKDYKGPVLESVGLNDVSTISYTSGTTEKGCPKGVKHSNRAYIVVSRFKSSDVSGMPEMKDLTAEYAVPVYSHTNIGNVADTFYCNCTYASEPFKETEFFLKSLIINKPNYVQSPVGRWIFLGKELLKSIYSKIKMPQLMLVDIVGEGCSAGEEKFLNETARRHKFGTKKLPFPLAPVTVSFGGGTCESGGVFTTLFHELQQKRLMLYGKKYSLGMIPFNMIEYEVLNQDGDYCGLNEPGILVANSPTSMLGYVDEELNEPAYMTDKYGKRWINMGTLAYKSDPRFKSVKMKGRVDDFVFLKDGSFFPTFRIEESISKDTKNILSCTVIKNDDGSYICHVEKQPKSKKDMNTILRSCALRLERDIPEEIFKRISFRVRSNEEGFPIAKSGKRNIGSLKNEDNLSKIIYIEDVFTSFSPQKNTELLLRRDKKLLY